MQTTLCLAPLHGVTIRVFRNAYFRHFTSFDTAMAPFTPSIRLAEQANVAHFKDILPATNIGIRLIPQIMSNDVADFISTANVIAGMGYGEVNWNLGCPSPMVTRKTRGASLLPHPDLIDRFLDAACSETLVPLSVKVRLGMADKGDLPALVPVLNRYPLAKVIVHPRIATQLYGGSVDLDAFGEAAESLIHRVVYNGDIRDAAGFGILQKRFPGIHDWMIGRGAIMDPFLPARIKGESIPADPKPALKAFHDDLYSGYADYLHGPRHLLDKMKEFWGYLAASFPQDEKRVRELIKAKSLEAYRRAVMELFA